MVKFHSLRVYRQSKMADHNKTPLEFFNNISGLSLVPVEKINTTLGSIDSHHSDTEPHTTENFCDATIAYVDEPNQLRQDVKKVTTGQHVIVKVDCDVNFNNLPMIQCIDNESSFLDKDNQSNFPPVLLTNHALTDFSNKGLESFEKQRKKSSECSLTFEIDFVTKPDVDIEMPTEVKQNLQEAFLQFRKKRQVGSHPYYLFSISPSSRPTTTSYQ